MAKKELILKLKNAKVERDKKWVFTLVKWALENQDKDITMFHRRISSAIYYAKGKHHDYWNNPRVKKQHKKSQEVCIKNNKNKYRERSKRYNTELRLAYKLFREGKLSDKSTKEIENNIKKIKIKLI